MELGSIVLIYGHSEIRNREDDGQKMELLTDSSVFQKYSDKKDEQTSDRELFEEGGSKAPIAMLFPYDMKWGLS